MKILLIEDTLEIIEILSQVFSLRLPEAEVYTAMIGRKGIELTREVQPDLIFLDLGLPDMDGFQVLGQIRSFSKVPIIILTVRGDEKDKIKGLEMGADDYIVKPFTASELLARLKLVLRRSQSPERSAEIYGVPFVRGSLMIDFQKQEVRVDGHLIKLSPNEYHLLRTLVNNEGKVLSKGMLLESINIENGVTDSKNIDPYINSLKDILQSTSGHPLQIVKEGDKGYKLVTKEE